MLAAGGAQVELLTPRPRCNAALLHKLARVKKLTRFFIFYLFIFLAQLMNDVDRGTNIAEFDSVKEGILLHS